MTRIRVEVTQADIDAGKRAGDCPLTRALHRHYPTAKVTAFGSWFMPGITGTYALSDAAREFVFLFDTRQPVQPATFVIEGPA